MFSYRHAFHVGNHADVLKHAILVAILRHLALKDKSFWVFDTHAGAGRYRLDAAQTRKNAEFRSGIEALWQARKLPALLADYVTRWRASTPSRRRPPASVPLNEGSRPVQDVGGMQPPTLWLPKPLQAKVGLRPDGLLSPRGGCPAGIRARPGWRCS